MKPAKKNQQDKSVREIRSGKINRRRFIGLSSLAAAGVMMNSCGEILGDLLPGIPPVIPSASDHRNIIIIGSGFGGAIAALRLTQSGKEVLMLERGKRWTPDGTTRIFSKNVPVDRRATWLSDLSSFPYGPPLPSEKYIGVLARERGNNIDVMAGAGYGGGSIVWGGLYVQPKKEIFEMVFPGEISYDELAATYYPRAKNMMQADLMPDDIFQSDPYTFARLHQVQNAAIGVETEDVTMSYNWERIREEMMGTRIKSAIIGESLYGNSSKSKIQLDETYLAEAEATGRLDVKLQRNIREVGRNTDGTYWVYVEEISPTGSIVSTKTYTTNYLFMAAGTIGTSKLMTKARAKGTLPNLNAETGRGWGNNGNSVVLRENLGISTGATQASPSGVATQDFGNSYTPLYVEHTQFPLGFDCECLNYFGIGINPVRGHFQYDSYQDEVKLHWPNGGNQLVNNALIDLTERLNTANGGRNSNFYGSVPFDKVCYHPCGGMVLGKAADFYGRVNNYDGLYVIDGSMMLGTSACANPSLTISALAERNIEHILDADF